ncbi:DUF4279 domain-containing protein [Fictibacillus iocasae]|uniref:DUF4279 domain-containing protein n=1 Tax=Fictibacillus iocasae TaxID=2715437 RepID=A0ABW2NMP0_9BACL
MAYFSAIGEVFPIEELTNILGFQPTETYKKGDEIDRPGAPMFRKETDWTFSTGYQESFDIHNQLAVILRQLASKTAVLKDFKEEHTIDYLLMVVISVEDNQFPAMYLPSDVISFTHSIGAEIHFDLYHA